MEKVEVFELSGGRGHDGRLRYHADTLAVDSWRLRVKTHPPGSRSAFG